MRGTWIRIGVAGALLIAAFVVAVVVLNSTVYSPSGFVRGYLDALVRKDVKAALALAGPTPSSSALDDFLSPDIMADLSDIEVTEMPDTETLATGHHIVRVAFTADGRRGSADFEVEDAGRVLGFFQAWAFTTPPLVQVDLTVLHARQFTANGVAKVTPVTDGSASYLAFAPGAIDFASDTEYTDAAPQTVVLDEPGRRSDVQLIAEANEALTQLVTAQATKYLDDCAGQTVLFPVGCPFGQDIADRIAPGTSPKWTITQYPQIIVTPTTTLGQWQVQTTQGVARLEASVQSIYDGSIAPFSAEVDFQVGYVATFVAEDDLVLTPQGVG